MTVGDVAWMGHDRGFVRVPSLADLAERRRLEMIADVQRGLKSYSVGGLAWWNATRILEQLEAKTPTPA